MRVTLILLFVIGCGKKGGNSSGRETSAAETGDGDSDSGMDTGADSGTDTAVDSDTGADTGEVFDAPACAFAADTDTDPPCTDCRFTEIGFNGWACGITVDGDIACWDASSGSFNQPIDGPYVSISAVPSGGFCALRADGRACCWPPYYYADLDPTVDIRFTAITAGSGFACGTQEDDTVACWGADDYGQADPPEGEFHAVAGGGDHTCGIRDDQTIACWGLNRDNCPDDGSCYSNHGQVDDAPVGGSYDLITASNDGSAAIDTDGNPVVWGWMSGVQPYLEGWQYISLALSDTGGCGVTVDGDILCDPYFLAHDDVSIPTDGPYTEVAISRDDGCALAADGHVDCWGLYIGPPP